MVVETKRKKQQGEPVERKERWNPAWRLVRYKIMGKESQSFHCSSRCRWWQWPRHLKEKETRLCGSYVLYEMCLRSQMKLFHKNQIFFSYLWFSGNVMAGVKEFGDIHVPKSPRLHLSAWNPTKSLAHIRPSIKVWEMSKWKWFICKESKSGYRWNLSYVQI